MKQKWVLMLAVALLPASSVAQMGGGMDMGDAPNNATGVDPLKMSKGEEKSWTACQAMAADAMANDKKCARLKKKVDRIAAAHAQ